jgi:hypothetical protein
MNEGTVTNSGVTDVTVIRDDAECIRILTDANLLDKAVRQEPYNTTNMVFKTDTHYCLCLYREGFSDPADNGYEIFQIPIENVPATVAAIFFYEIILADSEGGTRPKLLETFEYMPVGAN